MKQTSAFVTIGFLILGLLIVPAASAQGEVVHGSAKPVPKCSEQCRPLDPDVNAAAVTSGTVKTILYAHCLDLVSRCLINTQPLGPDDHVIDRGYVSPTINTPDPPGATGLHYSNNWMFWQSTAGFVEFQANGQIIGHPEPGMAEDVKISGDTVTLYFYVSAHAAPTQSDEGTGQNVPADTLANACLFAQIETGRTSFSSTSKVIAKGDTCTDDVAGQAHGQQGRFSLVTTGADQSQVYEIKLPLHVDQSVIPGIPSDPESKHPGYIVSINIYQVKGDDATGDTQGTQVTDNQWRFRQAPDFPSRIVVGVDDSLIAQSTDLSIYQDRLFVRWRMISPWGSYDVDDRSLTFDVTGPAAVEKDFIRLVNIRRGTGHESHFTPINATWYIEYNKAGLPDGDYVAHPTISNLQGTFKLEAGIPFKIVKGVPEGVFNYNSGGGSGGGNGSSGGNSPGFDAAFVLLGLAGAAMVALRRRSA